MILSISANHPDFRGVSFEPGMNVILADRDASSSDKDSRNGLGKSTLISIMHWLLGSSEPPRVPEIDHSYEFTAEIMLRDATVRVSRSANSNSNLFVRNLPPECPVQFQPTLTGEVEVAPYEWHAVLLWGWFGLEDDKAHGLSFRSLISYLLRRDPDGFADFRKIHPQQPTWRQQACLAFLLNLDWRYPVDLHVVTDEEKSLRNAEKVLKSSIGAEILNTPSNMENQKVQLDIRIERLGISVQTFKVHDEYHELEVEANLITQQLSELADRQVIESSILGRYIESIASEVVDNNDYIVQMYAEANIVLPGNVIRQLDDVIQFNQRVVDNRRSYLESEISRLEDSITASTQQILELSNRRASIMGILNTHGALDEYNRLHQELSEARSLKERLEAGIETTRRLETKKQELRVRKSELELHASNLFGEERDKQDRAIRLFAENTRHLYDLPGELHIDVNRHGLVFDVKISRAGSHGVENMKTFSFDLSVAQLWADLPQSPRLLVHDSVIFDGVDARQKAAALELASSSSVNRGFQYICFINSDDVPATDFSKGFSLDKYVKLVLNDRDPSGTLFGHRY